MPRGEAGIVLVEDNAWEAKQTMVALKYRRIANEEVLARDSEDVLKRLPHENCMKQLASLILLGRQLPNIEGLEALDGIWSDERTSKLPTAIPLSSSVERDLLNLHQHHANSCIVKLVDFVEPNKAAHQLGHYSSFINTLPRVEEW